MPFDTYEGDVLFVTWKRKHSILVLTAGPWSKSSINSWRKLVFLKATWHSVNSIYVCYWWASRFNETEHSQRIYLPKNCTRKMPLVIIVNTSKHLMSFKRVISLKDQFTSMGKKGAMTDKHICEVMLTTATDSITSFSRRFNEQKNQDDIAHGKRQPSFLSSSSRSSHPRLSVDVSWWWDAEPEVSFIADSLSNNASFQSFEMRGSYSSSSDGPPSAQTSVVCRADVVFAEVSSWGVSAVPSRNSSRLSAPLTPLPISLSTLFEGNDIPWSTTHCTKRAWVLASKRWISDSKHDLNNPRKNNGHWVQVKYAYNILVNTPRLTASWQTVQ